MKNNIIAFGLIVFSFSACAQKVQYTFSDEVAKEVNSYIEKSLAINSDTKFYIELSTVWLGDGKGDFLISIGDYTEKKPASELVLSLINNSNHFYQNGDLKIPIFFDYDSSFIGHGTDAKGRVIRKELMLHTFTIKFNRKGQVVKSK